MIPDGHKDILISSSIDFIRTVTMAYGADKGFELWAAISDTLDSDLKGQILISLLTGETSDHVTMIGVTHYPLQYKINAIREVRAASGLGLKEAKDLVESVESGNVEKMHCNSKDIQKTKVNLRLVGIKVL